MVAAFVIFINILVLLLLENIDVLIVSTCFRVNYLTFFFFFPIFTVTLPLLHMVLTMCGQKSPCVYITQCSTCSVLLPVVFTLYAA
jgi:hypothetical protein